MQAHFKEIKLVAKLDGSESSFSEVCFATGEATYTLKEARVRALAMVDRMFPDEDWLDEELRKALVKDA